MSTYYLAVTYDVCEHNNLYEEMNQYLIDATIDMEKQIVEFAKQDIAPRVNVLVSDSADFSGDNVKLYKTFNFKEFECSCTK